MSENQNIIIDSSREVIDTKAAKMVREEGQVPGVIYLLDKKSSLCIKVSAIELKKLIANYTFMTQLFTIKVDGRDLLVMPREVQFNPVSDEASHIDFMEVKKGDKIRVSLPLRIINRDQSTGVKRGGEVTILSYNVKVISTVGEVPNEIVVDVANSNIGDLYKLSTVELPQGIKLIRDYALARITGKSSSKNPNATDAAAPATVAAAPAAKAAAAKK